MPIFNEGWAGDASKRWMRPDAHLFLRPDWRRFWNPGHQNDPLYRFYESIERKFDPNQPRVPAGVPEGGQWTDAGGGNSGGGLGTKPAGGINDPRVISDVTPDNTWIPSAQYAQNTPRGPRVSGRILVNGRWLEATPGQQARYDIATARSLDAIRRVREVDPQWRPKPSIHGLGIENEILRSNGLAAEAEAHLYELARTGIGPGPFAGQSVVARGPRRDFTAAERAEINRMGAETGCHTCGTTNPGTSSGNFVPDHQPPSALNILGRRQHLFPHCLSCSLRQGGWISSRGSIR